MNESQPRVAVFGPHPLLSVTVELRGEQDDIHVHPAGQGVWVSRMVSELGAHPILSAFCGGETGEILRPLVDAMPGETRWVETSSASGSYVIDRRSGERQMIASSWSEPPSRHEVDDLLSIACATAIDAGVLVVTGPVPGDSLPVELFRNLVADARGNGATVLIDLSSPNLDGALEGKPSIVKLDDWQLATFVSGPVAEPEQLREAAGRVIEMGAESVVVTRGAEPALVLRGGRAWELTPPRFEEGASEGSGDSMVGAIAAAIARGLEWEDVLRVGAAAGAANFLRRGLGTGSREVVAELVKRVELRPV